MGFRPPGESEACCAVVRILGGKQVEVMKPDGNKMRCIIRSKFTGRRKRDNLLTPGTWVLVGYRDWETGVGDLLHVYDAGDVQQLKRTLDPAVVRRLGCADPLAAATSTGGGGGDEVVFEDGPAPSAVPPVAAEVQRPQDAGEDDSDAWIDMDEI